MLLSRVAESVYWTGRYLERAESTARIIKVHTELFLDLPKSAGVGWTPLLAITGSADAFDELYPTAGPRRSVVGFLIADGRNPGSILASLDQARENMRIDPRRVPPRGVGGPQRPATSSPSRRARRPCRRRARLRLARRGRSPAASASPASMAGTMSHDEAYSLPAHRPPRRAGRHDHPGARRAGRHAHQRPRPASCAPTPTCTWMSVLKSLSAYQMYRRRCRAGSRAPRRCGSCSSDPQFPRSVEHCLTEISPLPARAPPPRGRHDGLRGDREAPRRAPG